MFTKARVGDEVAIWKWKYGSMRQVKVTKITRVEPRLVITERKLHHKADRTEEKWSRNSGLKKIPGSSTAFDIWISIRPFYPPTQETPK